MQIPPAMAFVDSFVMMPPVGPMALALPREVTGSFAGPAGRSTEATAAITSGMPERMTIFAA